MRLNTASLILLVLCLSQASMASFNFVALGDAPYMDRDIARLKQLFSQAKEEKAEFIVHVGDIKTKGLPCSDENLLKARDVLDSSDLPLIYTPGDNEWTDCFDGDGDSYPVERLGFIRKNFYPAGRSLGKNPMKFALSQSQSSDHKKFVENNLWHRQGVSFATIHIVGSHNNKFKSDSVAMAEFSERLRATLWWLDKVFAEAKKQGSKALVLIYHAEMYIGSPSKRKQDGFSEMIARLKDLLQAFDAPVLAIHGDKHVYVVDHPLVVTSSRPGAKKPLFTRLQVYGFPVVRGVLVKVDTESEQVFSISPLPKLDSEWWRSFF